RAGEARVEVGGAGAGLGVAGREDDLEGGVLRCDAEELGAGEPGGADDADGDHIRMTIRRHAWSCKSTRRARRAQPGAAPGGGRVGRRGRQTGAVIPGSAPTKGRLLVATPPLDDPNFDRTVVYVLEHHHEGALGVVLNRPTDEDLTEPLDRWESV